MYSKISNRFQGSNNSKPKLTAKEFCKLDSTAKKTKHTSVDYFTNTKLALEKSAKSFTKNKPQVHQVRQFIDSATATSITNLKGSEIKSPPVESPAIETTS